MSNSNDLLARIEPVLRVLEAKRLSILDKRRKGTLAMVGVGFVALLGVMTLGRSGGPEVLLGLGGLLLAVLIIYAVFFSGDKAQYERAFKQHVVSRLAKELAPEMSYQPGSHVGKDWFRASGIYSSRPDRYRGEDYFGGRIGSTDLFFSEVHAEDRRTRRDSNGNTKTYYVTIFKGLFVVADFHKHFNSEVMVKPDGLEGFGAIGRALQKLGGGVERMENPEFERLFKVRASDAVEARYILTPLMQERFVELAAQFGSGVSASFKGSLVYLTIPKTRDWFEGSLNLPVNNPSQFRELTAQLQCCFGLVEQLDLNTRIWTKE